MLQSVRLRGENVWKVFRIMGAQLLKDKGKDMYENKLLTRIRNGKPAYGFSINYPEPAMLECITQGWDFVWLDAQHGFMDYKDLLQCSIACRAADINTIIRVPGHEFSVLGPVADLCPGGIMVPMVNSRKEAEKIAQSLHFPPKGNRSFWNARMIQMAGNNYYNAVEPLVIAQIETKEGVENAGDIIQTEGIDVLMLGPADLGLSYGIKPGTDRNENALMMNAFQRIITEVKKASKYSMFIASDPEDAFELIKMGADIIVCGSDYNFLVEASKRLIGELKNNHLYL